MIGYQDFNGVIQVLEAEMSHAYDILNHVKESTSTAELKDFFYGIIISSNRDIEEDFLLLDWHDQWRLRRFSMHQRFRTIHALGEKILIPKLPNSLLEIRPIETIFGLNTISDCFCEFFRVNASVEVTEVFEQKLRFLAQKFS